jgi:hypothetical protein
MSKYRPKCLDIKSVMDGKRGNYRLGHLFYSTPDGQSFCAWCGTKRPQELQAPSSGRLGEQSSVQSLMDLQRETDATFDEKTKE